MASLFGPYKSLNFVYALLVGEQRSGKTGIYFGDSRGPADHGIYNPLAFGLGARLQDLCVYVAVGAPTQVCTISPQPPKYLTSSHCLAVSINWGLSF